jgi:hypothetical protein
MAHVQTDVLGFQLLHTHQEVEQLRKGLVRFESFVHDDHVLEILGRARMQDLASWDMGYGVIVRHDWSDAPLSIASVPQPPAPASKKQRPV